MKNLAEKPLNFVKQNKLPLIAAVFAVAVVGLPTYAHQANKNKNVQPEPVKVAEQKPEPKKEEKPKVKAATTEEKEEPKTATTSTTTTTKPKTETTYTEKKKTYSEPTYVIVNVSLSVSGNTATAKVASAKPGHCYFYVKEIKDDGTYTYKDATVSASGGSCSWTFPAGDWDKLYVKYKSDDGTKKGEAYKYF